MESLNITIKKYFKRRRVSRMAAPIAAAMINAQCMAQNLDHNIEIDYNEVALDAVTAATKLDEQIYG